MNWQISTSDGPAGPFHHTAPPDDGGPQVWIRRLPAPALILGSTQPDELVRRAKAEAAGIEVCRRRSGGGLVFVDPETDCWIDLIVPRSSALWDEDVGRAFHWVGRHWARVLGDLLDPPGAAPLHPVELAVHYGGGRSPAGTIWCFADLGHGEVSLGGSKVVGLSQRRTRTWLRLQCLVLGNWPGLQLREYVDLDRLPELQSGRYPEFDSIRPALDPMLVSAGFPAPFVPPSPTALADRFLQDLPAP